MQAQIEPLLLLAISLCAVAGLAFIATLFATRNLSPGPRVLARVTAFLLLFTVGLFALYVGVGTGRFAFTPVAVRESLVPAEMHHDDFGDDSDVGTEWRIVSDDTPNLSAAEDQVRAGRMNGRWLVIAVLLVVAAAAMMASAVLAGQGRAITIRDVASGVLALLWGLPVVAVLMLLVSIVAPVFRDREPPQSIRYAEYGPVEIEPVRDDRSPAPATTFQSEVQETDGPISTAPTEGSGESTSAAQAEGNREPLPSWVTEPGPTPRGVERIVLSSRQWSTTAEAFEELERMASVRLKGAFHRHYAYKGNWELPARFTNPVNRNLFPKHHVEELMVQSGSTSFPMVRVHALLEITPEIRKELYESWRSQIAQRRLWVIGAIVGLATLTIAAVGGYLRLDAATNARYRRRLKLATVSMIVAGGLLAGLVVG